MLGELEGDGRIVIGDLEAGLGTVLRMQAERVDAVLVVADPSAKSIEVARRAVESASGRAGRVIVLANRVAGQEDLESITAVANGCEIVVLPEDAAITAADREGLAPIDVDAEAPAVRAIVELARRLAHL